MSFFLDTYVLSHPKYYPPLGFPLIGSLTIASSNVGVHQVGRCKLLLPKMPHPCRSVFADCLHVVLPLTRTQHQEKRTSVEFYVLLIRQHEVFRRSLGSFLHFPLILEFRVAVMGSFLHFPLALKFWVGVGVTVLSSFWHFPLILKLIMGGFVGCWRFKKCHSFLLIEFKISGLAFERGELQR
jgi:hypothetical protein